MSHKLQAQIAKQKRQQVEYVDVDEYAESLLRCLDGRESVSDNYEAGEIQDNQGASDGRTTEN
ncbi:hypothetical protein [Polaromonas sp. YR568]|uniref:hypothetical protein n=1 Tax=Polaromonas sp. YR568 TaxID=1855301 RepID=UPI0031381382